MTINEILKKYTAGEFTVEETNAELKNAGASFYLDPKKHELTADEIANGTAGLLDTGTASFDKVMIDGDTLVNCDCGTMKAFVCVSGEWYEVKGDKIVK